MDSLSAVGDIKNISSTSSIPASTTTKSGYNIDLFIDSETANKYLCAICHHVVSDCHETTCGHIFCGGCILRLNDIFKCPYCNKCNSSRPHKSIYLNRAVKNLRVKCPFHVSGCLWIGALSDLMVNGNNNKLSHLMNCSYSPITCDECNNKICRINYECHRAKCKKLNSCPNCKKVFHSSTSIHDKRLHYKQCPELVKCEHCKQEIKKQALSHHISFLCSQRLLKCPFYHFGCHEMIKSINLTKHLKYNATQHYQLKVDHCIDKIDKLKNQIESITKLYDESKNNQNVLKKQNENLSKQMKKLQSTANVSKSNKNQNINKDVNKNQNENENENNSYSDESDIAAASYCAANDCPDVIILLGSNKWEESGVFIRKSTFHENRVCYTSYRTKCAIRWNAQLSAWLIDRRGLATDNEASLIAYQNVKHPGLVTSNWLVYNDDVEEWVQSQNYRIKSYNLAEFIFKADQIFAQCSNINNCVNISHQKMSHSHKIHTIINDMNNTNSSMSNSTSPVQSSKRERNERNKENLTPKNKSLPPGLLAVNNDENINNDMNNTKNKNNDNKKKWR